MIPILFLQYFLRTMLHDSCALSVSRPWCDRSGGCRSTFKGREVKLWNSARTTAGKEGLLVSTTAFDAPWAAAMLRTAGTVLLDQHRSGFVDCFCMVANAW